MVANLVVGPSPWEVEEVFEEVERPVGAVVACSGEV